jgi:membrane associated rhomboid family serine protease
MSFSSTETHDDRPRLTPAVQWLIGLNILIYFLQVTVVGPTDMQRWFGFRAHDLAAGMPWTVFTYMFVHAGFWHIAMNMLFLWVFGPRVERTWGSGAFVRYYLICGLGGVLAQWIMNRDGTLIGASAAIYGVMLAYAVQWPDDEFLLWFVVPVKAKWLVAGCVLFDLLLGVSTLAGATSGVAHFAHLGGLVTGWLYLHTPPPSSALERFRHRVSRAPDVPDEPPRPVPRGLPRARDARREVDEIVAKSKAAVAKRPATAQAPRPVPRARRGDEINALLDKISQFGLDSLTSDERRMLEDASKRLRDDRS